MSVQTPSEQHAEEFNRHESRKDGAAVVGSLSYGLNVLRDSLYWRVHSDVQQMIGKDSMMMPVSEMKTARSTRRQIDIYQVAESAAAVKEHGYAKDAQWYATWLTRLRLAPSDQGEAASRQLADYMSKRPDDRRLAFTDVLAHTLAESRNAPLVVFRLLPPAVRIVTALAFGDKANAAKLRKTQKSILPAVADCRECRGGVLENGEICQSCGNPLWKTEWLTAAD